MSVPHLDRRRFLGLTGAAAAAGLVGGLALPRFAAAQSDVGSAKSRFGNPADRTLVVIDMQGGNDALNTLVPDSGIYYDRRPSVAIDEADLLTFDGLPYGVHPSLERLRSWWDAGNVAPFIGVGLPEQSRSHFVAQDVWRSARPGEPATSGWLGRWLEATAGSTEVPLRAISLGGDTLAARGDSGRAVAVQSVEGYRLSPPGGSSAVIDAIVAMGAEPGNDLFGEIAASLPATVQAVDQLQDIIGAVEIDGQDYGPDATASLFAATQAIIQADVGAQVLYLTLDGFDTHAVQANIHQALLESVAAGIDGLFTALGETGHDDRTMVLTVSEFGRRVAENGSLGTDHGKGGAAFLIGPAVEGGTVHGGVDLTDLDDGDLPIVIDTRSVYDNALRWLGGDVGAIEGDWSGLDVLAI